MIWYISINIDYTEENTDKPLHDESHTALPLMVEWTRRALFHQSKLHPVTSTRPCSVCMEIGIFGMREGTQPVAASTLSPVHIVFPADLRGAFSDTSLQRVSAIPDYTDLIRPIQAGDMDSRLIIASRIPEGESLLRSRCLKRRVNNLLSLLVPSFSVFFCLQMTELGGMIER